MAMDGPTHRDEELDATAKTSEAQAIHQLTAESLLDDEADDGELAEDADESIDSATPWTSMVDDDEFAEAVESQPELAKPIITAPQEVLQPAIAAAEASHMELEQHATPVAPVMAVTSAAVAPTEDDLQFIDEETDEDEVLRIGRANAADVAPVVTSRGGWWTIPTLCAGLAIVACSLIIPQTDANRRLAWEREKLERDLKSIQKQVEVNAQFLERVADDPNLAERLAQRQMKVYRQGTAVLELKRKGSDEMSPFLLTAVVPPEPLPAYESKRGTLSTLFLHPKHTLYLSGLGLLLIAAGLVMGGEKIQAKSE